MSYLKTFFAEKNLSERTYNLTSERDGAFHVIPSEMVIEMIHTTEGKERKFIEDTLRKIDFANGDVHHFLTHLAQQIANNY